MPRLKDLPLEILFMISENLKQTSQDGFVLNVMGDIQFAAQMEKMMHVSQDWNKVAVALWSKHISSHPSLLGPKLQDIEICARTIRFKEGRTKIVNIDKSHVPAVLTKPQHVMC